MGCNTACRGNGCNFSSSRPNPTVPSCESLLGSLENRLEVFPGPQMPCSSRVSPAKKGFLDLLFQLPSSLAAAVAPASQLQCLHQRRFTQSITFSKGSPSYKAIGCLLVEIYHTIEQLGLYKLVEMCVYTTTLFLTGIFCLFSIL